MAYETVISEAKSRITALRLAQIRLTDDNGTVYPNLRYEYQMLQNDLNDWERHLNWLINLTTQHQTSPIKI